MDVVDAVNRRPIFLLPQTRHREHRLLAAVRPVPFTRHVFGSVRCILEEVVFRVHLAVLDRHDLGVNGDHRFAETIQLRPRLTLGRLDHHRPGDRPRDRRCVKTVIHQPFGYILDCDLPELPQIDDALVGHQSVFAPVQDRERAGKPLGDVVGVEDGHLGGLGQVLRSHHRDVHPRDWKDARAAPGRCRDRAAVFLQRIARQKRHEMPRHADRPDARATAAMRDAEGLVQIQVADVRADAAGVGEADLCVQVRAVHVHLSAVFVDDGANLADAPLENAVGGRVGHHDCRQVFAVFFSAGAQIVEVDVAVVGGLAARHRHDFHPGHHGAGRVGAVRRYRDQADVALHVAAAFVVTANRQQPGEFALRAGVRLE